MKALEEEDQQSDLEKFKVLMERDIRNVSDVRKLADEVDRRLGAAEDRFIDLICDNIEDIAQLGGSIDVLVEQFTGMQAALSKHYDEIYDASRKIRELEADTKDINRMLLNRKDAVSALDDYLDLVNVDRGAVDSLLVLPVGSPRFIKNLVYFDNKLSTLSEGSFSKALSARQCVSRLESVKSEIDRRILETALDFISEKAMKDLRAKANQEEATYRPLFCFLLRTSTTPEAEKFIKTYSKKLITGLKTDIGIRTTRLGAATDPDVYTPPFGFVGIGKDYGYRLASTSGSKTTLENTSSPLTTPSPRENTYPYIDTLSLMTANGKVPKTLIVPQWMIDEYEDFKAGAGAKYVAKVLDGTEYQYTQLTDTPANIAAPFALESFNRGKLIRDLRIDARWPDNYDVYITTNEDFKDVFRQRTSRNPFKKAGTTEHFWMTAERAIYYVLARYINVLEVEVKFGLRMFGTDLIVQRVVEETSQSLDPFIESRLAGTSDFSLLLVLALFGAAELRCEANALGCLKPFFTRWKANVWSRLQPFLTRCLKILEIGNGITCGVSKTSKRSISKKSDGTQVDMHIPVGITDITIQVAFLLRSAMALEPWIPNYAKALMDKLFNTYTQYVYTVELDKRDITCRSYNSFEFIYDISKYKKANDFKVQIFESSVMRLCSSAFPKFYADYKMLGDTKLLELGTDFWRDLAKNLEALRDSISKHEPTSQDFRKRLSLEVARKINLMYREYYQYLNDCLSKAVILSCDNLVMPDVLKRYVCKSLGVEIEKTETGPETPS